MRPRFLTLAAGGGVLLLWCADLRAQGSVTKVVQRFEKRFSHDLSEAAEEMPEDRYAFKPTQAQMTFGEIVLHVAEANAFLCSAIARTPLPEQRRLVPTDSKDKLGGLLEDSFDVCDDVLDHADDSFLEDSIPYFGGRRTTRAAALIELASMWATNYSYLAIYLRLNGLEPPTAKRK